MKKCTGECGKFKIPDDFYQYENGRLHGKCKECTKKTERKKYKKRNRKSLKKKGMNKGQIDAYLKNHPIARQSIRERYCARYATN